MTDSISIIMPAYRAEAHVGGAVRSVLAQTWPHWRLLLVSDDGRDYEKLLADEGISDRRIQFLSSGAIGSGASRARNHALDRVETDFVAVLDVDDRFKPKKLEMATAALQRHPVVTTALDVVASDGRPLRLVGVGPDRLLTARSYKFTNLSMDSMVVWDRRRTDGRYDPTLANMNDLELLLQLWEKAEGAWHIGTPLHDYVKVASSLSNSAGVTDRMIQAKTTLLDRLARGHYRFADPGATEGVRRFLEISLEAERGYPRALARDPELLFEDHLEPALRAASSSPA